MAYGYCCQCNAKVVTRTRGIPSYDTCENGHRFVAAMTLSKPLIDRQVVLADALRQFIKAYETQNYTDLVLANQNALSVLKDLDLAN